MTPEEFEEQEARAIRAAERIRRIYHYTGDTPRLTPEQAKASGPEIAELARVVVERWRQAEGYVPQLLSVALIELRAGLIGATTGEDVECSSAKTTSDP